MLTGSTDNITNFAVQIAGLIPTVGGNAVTMLNQSEPTLDEPLGVAGTQRCTNLRRPIVASLP